MRRTSFLTAILVAGALIAGSSHASSCSSCKSCSSKWIPIFNGKDLNDWTPKFAGSELGEDPNDVFRAEDGVLKVCYDKVEKFKGDFGHLFYKTPYSHYKIRAEFRATGEQLSGGPGWAFRNNGLMLHCQEPASMELGQKFPSSIEAQTKGNRGNEKAPMGRLFTPGTAVKKDGKLVQGLSSSSPVFSGTDWVTMEVEVQGGKEFIHRVNGKECLRYQDPQLDCGTPIEGGYIGIQAETHPYEFRKIEILPLPGNQAVAHKGNPPKAKKPAKKKQK